MDKSNLLFDKIKSEKIQQKPKWHFQLKNNFFKVLYIGFILFGALSFSIILFAIQQADFDLLKHLSHSISEFILGITPVIWLFSLIIFLILAMLGIKNSKKGYKYTLSNLIAFSISFSVLIGTLFFISGGAQYLENSFATQFSSYKSIESLKMNRWSHPENGYLSGNIIKILESEIVIEDFNEQEWQVDISNAKVRGNKAIEEGMKIKFIGSQTNDDHFKADEIRHWGGNGRGPNRN